MQMIKMRLLKNFLRKKNDLGIIDMKVFAAILLRELIFYPKQFLFYKIQELNYSAFHENIIIFDVEGE